jgi:integrase
MLNTLTRGGEEHQSFASTIHVPTDVNRAPNKITPLPIPLVQLLRRAPFILGQRGTLSELGIHAIVKKIAYQARLEDVTAHTLRHSFA